MGVGARAARRLPVSVLCPGREQDLAGGQGGTVVEKIFSTSERGCAGIVPFYAIFEKNSPAQEI
jgi:hypothetical protein